MTVDTMVTTGLDGFVQALASFGADPAVEGDLVLYSVTPVTGALAGCVVRTAVAVGEVGPWPTAPPHWIHLPLTVTLPGTNAGASPKEGWAAHSRDVVGWGTSPMPVAAWLAHVRGVIGTAA